MDEGFFPVHERLIRGMRCGKDEVAIVDVGGNMGHDLQELKRKQPDLRGRFVLQDQPHVLNQIHEPLKDIELMCHDFFTEQPIKGIQVSSINYGLPLKAYIGQDLEHITCIPYSMTGMTRTRGVSCATWPRRWKRDIPESS